MKSIKTISILLIPMLVMTGLAAVVLPSVVYGNGGGKTISGPAESTSRIALPTIAERTVDLNGDGVADLSVTTRLATIKYTGVLKGNGTMLQTVTVDLRIKIARATYTVTFWGTVGDSEPGVMTMISTFISDRSDPALWKYFGNAKVVEGSGLGGLEGICGYGTYQGQGPPPAGPFVTSSNYEFRFGNACNTATIPG